MPLISEDYRRLNAQLHAQSAEYGASGQVFAALVGVLAERLGTRDILDYGCGKRTLEQQLGFTIANYDPAVPGCYEPPEAAYLVVCTETLEHVEPECLDDVMLDLGRVTEQIIVLTVATKASTKLLPDGRNSHLIIQPKEWWLEKIGDYFEIVQESAMPGGGVLVIAQNPDAAVDIDFGHLPTRTKLHKCMARLAARK